MRGLILFFSIPASIDDLNSNFDYLYEYDVLTIQQA